MATEPQSARASSLLARGALAVIRFYQRFISPGLPPACRFYPSCSRYTYGAIERFGLARGLWLGTGRVCRCHPWNAGGIDEVPAQFPAPGTVAKRTVAKIKSLLRRHLRKVPGVSFQVSDSDTETRKQAPETRGPS